MIHPASVLRPLVPYGIGQEGYPTLPDPHAGVGGDALGNVPRVDRRVLQFEGDHGSARCPDHHIGPPVARHRIHAEFGLDAYAPALELGAHEILGSHMGAGLAPRPVADLIRLVLEVGGHDHAAVENHGRTASRARVRRVPVGVSGVHAPSDEFCHEHTESPCLEAGILRGPSKKFKPRPSGKKVLHLAGDTPTNPYIGLC
jgi:hypothetical protein